MRNLMSGRALPAAIVFGLSFGVYLACLAPTITWSNEGADSGDLATAVHTLGIAHPPGYPTYVLLGWLFHWLPSGDTAYRLNLMSAFWASLSAVLVYLTVLHLRCLLQRRHENSMADRVAAGVAALALAFSPVFWSQATIAEVYTLNAFFVAAILYLLINRLLTPPQKVAYHLPLAAGLFGLGLGNHLSLVWLLPGALLLVAARGRPAVGQGLMAALLFLVGISIYAYLPWAASRNHPINWGNPVSWPNFSWLVSADIYRQFVFASPLQDLPSRLSNWLHLMAGQFHVPGLLLGLLGLAYICKRRPLLAVSGLLFFLLTSLYSVTYNTADSYIYLIPAFLVLAIWLGCGLCYVVDRLEPWLARTSSFRQRLAYLLWIIPLLLPATSLYLNYPSQNLSADRTAYRYAETVFSLAEPDAIIIADTDQHIFSLVYYRYVVDTRSGTIVVIRNLLGYRWYQENLRRLHPDLVLASNVESYSAQLLAIVNGNRGRPIYLTGPDAILSGRFPWAERGALFWLPPVR